MTDAPSTGHNSGAAEIRQFQQRIERLEEETKSIRGDIKEVYAEMKGRGIDVKAFREARRRQRLDKDVASLVEVYEEHLLSELLS